MYNNEHEFELTVCDEFGNEVTDYKYEDICGMYVDDENSSVMLTVVTKEHLRLHKYLSFISCDGASKGACCLLANFILITPYEHKEDCHTVAGIILNTDGWSIDDDILTLYFYEYDFSIKSDAVKPVYIRYKITDIQKFNNILAKLKVLYKRK